MSEPIAQKLLLLGWDAADWQMIHPLLDSGRMPNLKRLVETGVMGHLLTLQPILSPILWTSIATGKRAYLHGVHGFVEPTPDGAGLRPTSSSTRKCKALWNILAQSGKRCQAVGWYASHPAEDINGVCISHQFPVAPASATPANWPPQPNSVHPANLADALADLRVHPGEVSGPMLSQFIPLAEQLDQSDPEVRRLLNSFAKRLAECASLHAVTTAVMEEQPWDFCTAYYEAIDHIGHDFMAFHPPRMEQVRPDLFAVFQGVMNATYEFHDLMLGRLLELAGPDVHVMIVSDHGFHNGASRPKHQVDPAQWHRNFGVFVLAGPGIKKDAILHGATLLDIAPTVLAMFGLPVGRDMEGKVLVNAFEVIPDFKRIASWEEVPDPRRGARVPDRVEDDPEAAAAALQQLVELGYLEAPGEDVQRDIKRARAEQKFNLACTYVDGKQPARALNLAEELAQQFPDQARYLVLAGQAAVSAGDAAALGRVMDALEVLEPTHQQITLFRAFHCWLKDDIEGALRYFEIAATKGQEDSWLLCRIGRAYLRLRRWSDAETAFRKSILLDEDNAEAYYGLSVALPRQDRLEEGIRCGLNAVSLLHDFPLAHFQLGAVLSRMGWYDRALQAFEICLAMRPQFALAHRYVAQISSRLGRLETANRHRDMATRVLAEGVPQPAVDQGIAHVGHDSIAIVSGLPRSGTSLMMQMLQAGGLPALTDGLRSADESNPRGYFEFEPVKRLRTDRSWLPQARGHAVKIVHLLLRELPLDGSLAYRIILMQRPIEEVLASQSAMLRREGRPAGEPAILQRAFENQLAQLEAWLAAQPSIAVLPVDYHRVLREPAAVVEELRAFLDLELDVAAMLRAVDPALYRQRGAAAKLI